MTAILQNPDSQSGLKLSCYCHKQNDKPPRMSMQLFVLFPPLYSWAARIKTWLLMEVMQKRRSLSFYFHLFILLNSTSVLMQEAPVEPSMPAGSSKPSTGQQGNEGMDDEQLQVQNADPARQHAQVVLESKELPLSPDTMQRAFQVEHCMHTELYTSCLAYYGTACVQNVICTQNAACCGKGVQLALLTSSRAPEAGQVCLKTLIPGLCCTQNGVKRLQHCCTNTSHSGLSTWTKKRPCFQQFYNCSGALCCTKVVRGFFYHATIMLKHDGL